MHDATLHLSRRSILALIGSALVLPTPAPASAKKIANLTGTAFGTYWRITGPTGAGLDRIRPEIEALFATINHQMSPWRRDGTVGHFNTAPSGWHAAEAEVVHVTKSALALAEQSGGAFDPTVGPIVAQWGFGPIAGGRPDWRGLSVSAGRIAKSRDDLTLDLCGIAKGWALDRVAELALEAGLDELLIDLGGELCAVGRHPLGRPWQIAVQHTLPGYPAPAVLQLPPGKAVATSGLRNQSFQFGGRTYGHIIDPALNEPADGPLHSVTVLSSDAMTADGWATALFAAGAARGPALARLREIPALFLTGDTEAPDMIVTGKIEHFLL